MFWIQLVVVTGVIFVIAAVVLGAGGSLPDAYREQPELRMPADRPLTSADVDHIRFPVVLRGYRMSEVDDVLDRLTGELAARDARILELEYKMAGTAPEGITVAVPAGVGATALGATHTTPPPRAGRGPSLEKAAREPEFTGEELGDGEFGDEEFADAPSVNVEPAPAAVRDTAEADALTDAEPDTTADAADAGPASAPDDVRDDAPTADSGPSDEASAEPNGEPSELPGEESGEEPGHAQNGAPKADSGPAREAKDEPKP